MREHAVLIKGRTPLVGIVTEPDHPARDAKRPGVVLLNSGLIHRVGPNRLYVLLARRLGAMGLTTLRFDLSAIGDSPQRRDTVPFHASSIEETMAALDFMREQWGIQSFVLGGICTGAVVTFRTALQNPDIKALIMINAQGLIRNRSAQVEESLSDRAGMRYYMAAALRRRGSWTRLLTGQADYRAIAQACGQRLKDLLSTDSVAAAPEQQEIIEGMDRLLGDGRQILLLYSDSDAGLDELAVIYGKEMLQRLKRTKGISFSVIAQADHMFTALDRQEEFLDLTLGWIRTATPSVG